MKEENKPIFDKHWVIKNDKRNCIWKQPYASHAEAQQEYNLQLQLLGLGRTHGFKIEEHTTLFSKK